MITVIQNDPEVPSGTWGDYLDASGLPWRIVRPYAGDPIPSPGEISALIVLGGSMGVHDSLRFPFLLAVKTCIRDCAGSGIPYLGICLGGQLLADVLGADVLSGRRGEKGSLPVQLTDEGGRDPLFAGVDSTFTTFQWHDDSFDLPEKAILLATSPTCPNQAFRYGTSVYGTQFHPEVNRAIVDCWAHWDGGSGGSLADEFVASFSAVEDEYRAASLQILRNFLDLASLRKKVSS